MNKVEKYKKYKMLINTSSLVIFGLCLAFFMIFAKTDAGFFASATNRLFAGAIISLVIAFMLDSILSFMLLQKAKLTEGSWLDYLRMRGLFLILLGLPLVFSLVLASGINLLVTSHSWYTDFLLPRLNVLIVAVSYGALLFPVIYGKLYGAKRYDDKESKELIEEVAQVFALEFRWYLQHSIERFKNCKCSSAGILTQ